MTLTTRLSLFFLGALALVLVGFSTTLYLLAHAYLNRQVDERLEAALNTLTAAAEVGPGGVEWEPHERLISLGQESDTDGVSWIVCDDTGRLLSRSVGLAPENVLTASVPALQSATESRATVAYQGQSWLLGQRRVEALSRDGPAGSSPPPSAVGKETRPAALVLTAGVSLEPVTTKLRNLAGLLGGLSLGVWLLAAILGRWLCRRALVPVSSMAVTARAITSANLEQRLPRTGTGDELDDLGRAFNDLLARLQESFERQRRFTGDASHQLRTPLAAMLGQVEVALRRDRAPEEYRQVLALVNEQADRLRKLIDMMLFLARADAESRSPQLEPLSLADWLPTYLRRWTEHPRAADLRMECPAGDTFQVKVHEPLLSQLLDNLLDNACKYSDPGTLITLRVWREGGTVALAVEDAGAGIAALDLSHIFEPFYRSAQARRRGIDGVGLGLAIAKRIASALSGSLGVQSELGHGTKFTLHLTS
jgi:heavy metal sensor kinase